MHGGFPADAVLLHPGKRLRTMKRKHNSELFLLLYLGILSAFGPFVMDMYLPAFPVLTEFFGASSSMVQLSLTASTIGLAAGQLFFGTVSDKYGRRPALLTALGLFMLATAGCLLAGSHPRLHRPSGSFRGWPRPEASSSRGRSPPIAMPSANSRGCWPS